MVRYLMIVLAVAVGFSVAAQGGGPPPMYVVVDKVVMEPSRDAPERIKISGSFIRLKNAEDDHYGKPVEGYVFMSLDKTQKAQTLAEWHKWQKAAGTGKVVAVGSCHQAGSMLTITIRKSEERPTKPDAAYTPDFLERFGQLYVQGDLEREVAVRDLLAFVKARTTTSQSQR